MTPDSYAAGVLTSADAVRMFGRGRVRNQLATRRWQRAHHGVLVLHSGPLTDDQHQWVALLACPPGSALSGLDSLRWDGLTGRFAPTDLPVAVTMPAGSRRPTTGLVRPHWSEQLGAEDVHPLRLPRRTRPARSTIDDASWSSPHRARRARVIVLAAAQQRVVQVRDLYAVLARRGTPRHRGIILESIHDASGGIQSLPERDFDAIRRRWRLPKPARQSVLQRPDGRLYLDVDWRKYGSRCEIHGIPHSFAEQWDADVDRTNEITLEGPRLLVFTSYAVRHAPRRVGDQLVRLLRRGGWSG